MTKGIQFDLLNFESQLSRSNFMPIIICQSFNLAVAWKYSKNMFSVKLFMYFIEPKWNKSVSFLFFYLLCVFIRTNLLNKRDRMRPRAHMQNQHRRELITAQKMSHKHKTKDPSRLRWLSPGMWVNIRYTNSTSGKSSFVRKYMRSSVPLVEFMYLAFTGMPGQSYCRRLGSLLLCLCDVFWALINSLVFWF